MAENQKQNQVRSAKQIQEEQRLFELCMTLEDQPHIKEVWFDKKGNHYFVAREYKGKHYSQLKLTTKEVTLPGNDIRVAADYIADPAFELVRRETREEILKRKPALVLED